MFVVENRAIEGFSWIESDFKPDEGEEIDVETGVFFWGKREENKTSQQKKINARQFQGFKEIVRSFYLQADGASFAYAVMIMTGAYRCFGKEHRKTQTNHRNQKQYFPFLA